MLKRLPFTTAALLLAGSAFTLGAPAGHKVDFDRDIRPILSDNCFACHGPDEKQRMAGLHFDTKEGAFGKKGVITPGDSSKSRLFLRVNAEKPAMRMPPAASDRKLTKQQIELLRQWIDQGANWQVHWAYDPPKRPELPLIKDKAWTKNPIDHFVLAKLEGESLQHAPAADKTTLLRRVTFDLTGLPPTPAELDAFLKDKSANAYEKVVDRLLASPHYGEHMAMQWLDIARYSDTHGYHIDSHRDMWPWRDWVIKAYNSNMPYNQFTVEQLAGDLLPNATLSQKVATGFNRNHMINFEGGAIPEEYQVEYVVDRASTTGTAWLGLTMGCARCHDHKYDPIKQKEFYEFYAFFNTIPEKGLDGRSGNAEPYLPVPDDKQKALLDKLQAAIKEKEAVLSEKEVTPVQSAWEKSQKDRLAEAPRQGLLAQYDLDGSFADVSGNYRHGRTLKGDAGFSDGRVDKAANFSGPALVTFGNNSASTGKKQFSLAMWLKPTGKNEMAVIQQISDPKTRRGYEVAFDEAIPIGDLKRGAHFIVRLISQWPDDIIQIQTKERFAREAWYHTTVTYDGSGKASGLHLYIDGKEREIEIGKDHLTGSFANDGELQIGNQELGGGYRGQIDDLRIYDHVLSDSDIQQIVVHYPIQAIVSGQTGKRSKEDDQRVRDYFLTYKASQNLRNVYAELKKLQQQKNDLEKTIPTVMVMAEMEKPRETFVLGRGDYRNHGDKVQPDVPAVLPPLPKDAPRNRLTLAKWLVNPAHPLTARVAINRYWQMYFGNGLVKTSEDFGSQGEPPINPALLDWLATEFIRTNWDVKAMQRLIVTSATYRQSSVTTPTLIEKDPENRLLAHGPRFRLTAEAVRDNALAASGLLNDSIGGKSVFPYQPKGLWEEMAYGDVYSAQSYTQSTGRDLYRRSMYTFWKRTVPPPSLTTFDAPDREKCTARRSPTNTPLQALALLNDPTFLESARVLAERSVKEGGATNDKRIRYAFRLATARPPSAEELKILDRLYREELQHYRQNKNDSEKLLRIGESPLKIKADPGELAALTMVASTILNMDETITKE